jgi:hypothetical protein
VPLGILLANGALWIGAWIALRRGPVAPLLLWGGALVFRLCGFFAEPVLEDDHHRFLWDGFVFARTGDPYASAPADWFAARDLPQAAQQTLDHVSHPEVPTIYGPLCQYAFGLAHRLAPGELWPWKLVLLAADLALLVLLLRGFGPVPAWIHAWCPLLIFETSFNAHPELLAVALAFAALVRSLRDRHASAAWLLGLAVAAKVTALLLVPFVVWRGGWRTLGLPACVALLYLPFWLQGSPGDLAGLRAFAAGWEFNSSAFALLGLALAPGWARAAALATALAAMGGLFLRWARAGAGAMPRGDLLFGIFLLCSPVVNPWYLLWLLPFVCLRPTWTGMAAMVLVSLSYCHGVNLTPGAVTGFEHPTWLRWVEYGGLGLVFAVEASHWRARRRRVLG